VPLWNRGDEEGCCAVYRQLCTQHRQVDPRFEFALTAPGPPDAAEFWGAPRAGWLYRAALDSFLAIKAPESTNEALRDVKLRAEDAVIVPWLTDAIEEGGKKGQLGVDCHEPRREALV